MAAADIDAVKMDNISDSSTKKTIETNTEKLENTISYQSSQQTIEENANLLNNNDSSNLTANSTDNNVDSANRLIPLSIPTDSQLSSPIPSPSNNSVPSTGDDLLSAISAQVDFYFSRHNLANDAYLVSQMNNQKYVNIDIIAQFKRIRQLTSDKQLIIDSIQQCKNCELNVEKTAVRPLSVKSTRNTLILRDIKNDTDQSVVGAIFDRTDCPAKPVSIRSDVGDTWFVTFNTEEECTDVCIWCQNQTFNDKPIQCRVKSETLLRGSNYSQSNIQTFNPTGQFGSAAPIPPMGMFPYMFYNPYLLPSQNFAWQTPVQFNPSMMMNGLNPNGSNHKTGKKNSITGLNTMSKKKKSFNHAVSTSGIPVTAKITHSGIQRINANESTVTLDSTSWPQLSAANPTQNTQNNQNNIESENNSHSTDQVSPSDTTLDRTYDREQLAEIVEQFIQSGENKNPPDSMLQRIKEDSTIFRQEPLNEIQLLEPFPVIFPGSPSPLLAAQPHHSGAGLPFLDLNSHYNHYLQHQNNQDNKRSKSIIKSPFDTTKSAAAIVKAAAAQYKSANAQSNSAKPLSIKPIASQPTTKSASSQSATYTRPPMHQQKYAPKKPIRVVASSTASTVSTSTSETSSSMPSPSLSESSSLATTTASSTNPSPSSTSGNSSILSNQANTASSNPKPVNSLTATAASSAHLAVSPAKMNYASRVGSCSPAQAALTAEKVRERKEAEMKRKLQEAKEKEMKEGKNEKLETSNNKHFKSASHQHYPNTHKPYASKFKENTPVTANEKVKSSISTSTSTSKSNAQSSEVSSQSTATSVSTNNTKAAAPEPVAKKAVFSYASIAAKTANATKEPVELPSLQPKKPAAETALQSSIKVTEQQSQQPPQKSNPFDRCVNHLNGASTEPITAN